ncbi:Gph1 [Desulforapulum autotrophicum HRM2]|jgi:phosphoglycolate phosphatase|uniref:Gph1 n=1 Tax=Desulforapulum autotrophicum (strain ATCC 43914 / DSM 3382 / VKM B-1955 / HRM2) TaxID=177437 RepID=C0QKE2_DESAH|nr:HAD family hydrolase [Desulforapulum autotrophicum]ACN14013.1 Gph1 [Desulforapulum autotrophicum HRM2]
MDKISILFDLDGTLTDPYQGITRSICHAMASLGRPLPPQTDLRWCIGPPLKESFSILLESDDDSLVENALVIYRERFGSIGLFENKLYAGIPQALKKLQEACHPLFVATSKPWVYAQRIVDHFGLGQYFNHIHGSELDGTRTDKTSLVSYILNRESLDPSRAVMVGDRRHDMIGATANKVRGIGVLWGFGTQKELTDSGASACIQSPPGLVTAFSKKNSDK